MLFSYLGEIVFCLFKTPAAWHAYTVLHCIVLYIFFTFYFVSTNGINNVYPLNNKQAGFVCLFALKKR